MQDLSSLTRDRTHAPALGARSLNHWTTGEVPLLRLFWSHLYTSPCSRPTGCLAVSRTHHSSLGWPSRYLHASLSYFLQISAQIRFHQRGLFPSSNIKWTIIVNSINFHPFSLLYFALLSHDILIVYFLLIETQAPWELEFCPFYLLLYPQNL